MILLLALLIGVVAGLRAFTAPAAVSWAAYLGLLGLGGTGLGFLGYRFTPWIFTALAVFELIGDQLPGTPSRKVPVQFVTRLILGALAGAAIGGSAGLLVPGLVTGVVGAVVGTYGGAAFRAALARGFGRDLPAALIEDVVAVGGAALIVLAL
ncbi:MAG TPA: DUF4126 family protein [Novosphingobium sp.]|nr:DUF4126 family protein [Novosphingobium sp.]